MGRYDLLGAHRDLIGRDELDEEIGRVDIVGFEDDDDDDDDEISGADIIGAMNRAIVGKALTHKDRKALRKMTKATKKQMRNGANVSMQDELSLDLRKARLPMVRTEEEGILRVLNMPLGSITVPAGTTNDFVIVAQDDIRAERLILYPTGGNYDNLFVVNIFAGRQPNSVVPGLEEPMISYSATAVGLNFEGFTINGGRTLRITILNRTGAPVVVSGKIKGRTIT